MGEGTDEVRFANDLASPVVEPSSSTNADASDGGQDAEQIRSGIEQTRADLSETIDALHEKLDPARIAEQVKDQIRDKATEAYDTAKNAVKEATIGKAEKIMSNVSETVSNMSETVTNATGRAGTAVKDTSSSIAQYIRDNPVPFALIGIGAGMLALSTRRKDRSGYDWGRNADDDVYGRSGTGDWNTGETSLTDRAQEVAGSAASSVRNVAASAADTTREQFNQVSDQARQSARVASDRFKTVLQDNPMAVGVAVLAAGAIVGLSLPTTRVENEYLGEARDRLVGQAKSAAHEAAEKVQRVTSEAGRTLKDAAQKEGLVTGQQ
jgi:ElaB/YqjD/DUF883 family membrane-anchored ribosome-binding protein